MVSGQVTDTATATGVGVIGGASPKSDPSTVTIPTVAQPPEPGGDGPGPVDGGVPVGGVQTGGLPAPAGHAARGEALVALGGLTGAIAFVLALHLGVRRSRLLAGSALGLVAAAVVATALPAGRPAPAGAPAAKAVDHRARTTPMLPTSNQVHLVGAGMRVRVPAIT